MSKMKEMCTVAGDCGYEGKNFNETMEFLTDAYPNAKAFLNDFEDDLKEYWAEGYNDWKIDQRYDKDCRLNTTDQWGD